MPINPSTDCHAGFRRAFQNPTESRITKAAVNKPIARCTYSSISFIGFPWIVCIRVRLLISAINYALRLSQQVATKSVTAMSLIEVSVLKISRDYCNFGYAMEFLKITSSSAHLILMNVFLNSKPQPFDKRKSTSMFPSMSIKFTLKTSVIRRRSIIDTVTCNYYCYIITLYAGYLTAPAYVPTRRACRTASRAD